MAHVSTTAYEARLISLRCEKSEREGVAANERDGARNGDGQMFCLWNLERDVQLELCLGPRLWNALTHFRVQKKREPASQPARQIDWLPDWLTVSEKIHNTLENCVLLVPVMVDEWFQTLCYAFYGPFFFFCISSTSLPPSFSHSVNKAMALNLSYSSDT